MRWPHDSRAETSSDDAQDARRAPVTAVTFDVTRTLIHSPRLAEIYAETLRRHGLRAPAAELRRRIPIVWQEMSCLASPRQDRFSTHPDGAEGWWRRFVARLCQHLDLPEPSRFATAELFARFGRADAWELFPDVLPCLERLRRLGVRLGVVSNWDHRLPALLEDFELAPYFDSITFSSGCGLEKPHPRIFLACLEELGAAAAQALHVGDSALEDVEGAEAVGMSALRVERTGACDLWQMVRPMLRRPLDQ